jgi:O-antigen/teichoic acid export membrane protein
VSDANSRQQSGLRSATLWSYAQTLGRMGITTGLTLVLAAFLGPRAFGVMALALAFTGLIEMLQKQGLMPAIIQRPDLRSREADTAFWMVCAVGLILTAAGLILAPYWATLNDLPELTDVIRILALGVPISSLVVVQEAVLLRSLGFKQLAIRTWVSAATGGAAGIAGAVLQWGVWALVAQQLTTSIVAAIVLWSVSSWRPGFHFDLTAARSLWTYSLRSIGGSIGLFFGARIDLLLAGPLFGPVVVGIYRMANRLTTLVVDVSARSMQAVALPALSALQDEMPAFRVRLTVMQRATTVLCLPALGIVAGAASGIESILGPQWVGVGTAVRLLVIGQAATSMCLLFGPSLQAAGRPGLSSVLIWVWLVTSAVFLPLAAWIFGSGSGLIAVCVAVSASAVVALIAHCAVATRVLGLNVPHMLKAWLPGAVGGLAGALAAWGAAVALAERGPWLEVMVSGLVGLLASGVAVLLAAPDYRRALRISFRHATSRARSSPS